MAVGNSFKSCVASNFKRVTEDDRYLQIASPVNIQRTNLFDSLSAEYPAISHVFTNIQEQQQKLRFGSPPDKWMNYYIWPRDTTLNRAYSDIVNHPVDLSDKEKNSLRSEFINGPVYVNGKVHGPTALNQSVDKVTEHVKEAEQLKRRLVLSVVGKVGSGKSCFSRFFFSCRRKKLLLKKIIGSRIAFSQIIDNISSNNSVDDMYIRIMRSIVRDIMISSLVDNNFYELFKKCKSEDANRSEFSARLKTIRDQYCEGETAKKYLSLHEIKSIERDINLLSDDALLAGITIVNDLKYKILLSLDGFDLVNCVDFYVESHRMKIFELIGAIAFRRTGVFHQDKSSDVFNKLSALNIHYMLFLRDTTYAYFQSYSQESFENVHSKRLLLAPPSFEELAGGVLDRILRSVRGINQSRRNHILSRFIRINRELNSIIGIKRGSSVLAIFNFNARKAKRFFGIMLAIAIDEALRGGTGKIGPVKDVFDEALADANWQKIKGKRYKIWEALIREGESPDDNVSKHVREIAAIYRDSGDLRDVLPLTKMENFLSRFDNVFNYYLDDPLKDKYPFPAAHDGAKLSALMIPLRVLQFLSVNGDSSGVEIQHFVSSLGYEITPEDQVLVLSVLMRARYVKACSLGSRDYLTAEYRIERHARFLLSRILRSNVYLESVALKTLLPKFVRKYMRTHYHGGGNRAVAVNAIVNMAAMIKYITLHEKEEKRHLNQSIKTGKLTSDKYTNIFIADELQKSVLGSVNAMVREIESIGSRGHRYLNTALAALRNLEAA